LTIIIWIIFQEDQQHWFQQLQMSVAGRAGVGPSSGPTTQQQPQMVISSSESGEGITQTQQQQQIGAEGGGKKRGFFSRSKKWKWPQQK
jgi:hypothetical protein